MKTRALRSRRRTAITMHAEIHHPDVDITVDIAVNPRKRTKAAEQLTVAATTAISSTAAIAETLNTISTISSSPRKTTCAKRNINEVDATPEISASISAVAVPELPELDITLNTQIEEDIPAILLRTQDTTTVSLLNPILREDEIDSPLSDANFIYSPPPQLQTVQAARVVNPSFFFSRYATPYTEFLRRNGFTPEQAQTVIQMRELYEASLKL